MRFTVDPSDLGGPRDKPQVGHVWRPDGRCPMPDVFFGMLPSEYGGATVRDWRQSRLLTKAASVVWSQTGWYFDGSASQRSVPTGLTCGTSHTWVIRYNWNGATPSAEGGIYLYDQQTSRLIIAPRDGSAGTLTKIAYYDGAWRLGGPTLTQGWQTITWVFDGAAGKVHIYQDGGETTAAQTYSPIALSNSGAQSLFNRYADGTVGRMSGQIDYIQIFFRALTPAQVMAHYQDPYMWLREPRRLFYSVPSGGVVWSGISRARIVNTGGLGAGISRSGQVNA